MTTFLKAQNKRTIVSPASQLMLCVLLAVGVGGNAYGQSTSKEYIRVGGRVIAVENQALTITTPSLPVAPVGSAYAATVAAAGGTSPYQWSWSPAAGSQLPAGLTLSAAGAISGTAATAGTYTIIFQAKDATNLLVATKQLSLVAATALTISTGSLPDGTAGTAYSQTLTPAGGSPQYTWADAGTTLPSWLTIGSTTGLLSGTPPAAANLSITIQVTDANSQTTTKTFSLVIHGPLNIGTTSLSSATVNTSYSQTIARAGGTPPYTWSISTGSLPSGLILDSSSGVISGTPTVVNLNPANFTVRLQDSVGASVTQVLTIPVAALPSITTSSLPAGTLGSVYSQTLAASGGVAPFTWSVVSGSLPNGLLLGIPTGSTVALSGTPVAAGTFSPTIKVTDSNGASAQRAYTIAIAGAITITTTALPGGITGATYSTILAASGGQTPYTWSVTSGLLPAGLSLAGNTGTISGMPQNTATVNFTVTVTDAGGLTASQPLSITVSAIFSIQAARGYVYAGQQDTITANQPATWALSGLGSVSPTSLSSTTTFTAPATVSSAQSSHITATAGTATASFDETLLPAVPTLNPASGSYQVGQTVGFTQAGSHTDNWTLSNDYLVMNFTPGVNWQSTNVCVVWYQPTTQTVSLTTDDGNGFSSAAISSTTTLFNSQCSISLPGSATLSGSNLAVRLNVTFSAGFLGSKTSWIEDYFNGGISYGYAEGTITVTSPGGVSLTPKTVSLAFGGKQQFTATVTGQTNTAVNWTLTPAIGVISTSGMYTVPTPMSDQRTVTVTATSQANGAAKGSATVTLVVPATLHLTSADLPAGTQYGATTAITADGGFVIGSGQIVTLTSGGTITLDPGFHASAGSLFRANIDPTVH